MSESAAPAQSFSDSLRRLKAAQKSSRGAPLYSLIVNRPMGRFFAASAHQARLTPNHVTVISAVCTFAGIAAIALLPPGLTVAVVATAALVLGYGLDAADGQLARLRGGGSLQGEWLDHSIDSVKVATLHLAVLVTAYHHFPVGRWWLYVPLLFTATYVVHFFGMLLTDLLVRVRTAETGTPTALGPSSRAMSALKLPTDYGLLCWSFALLAVPVAFMVVYTALTAATLGYTALVLPRWYQRLKRLN